MVLLLLCPLIVKLATPRGPNSGIAFEEGDIAIRKQVFFALQPELSGFAGCLHRTSLDQFVKGDHFGFDEGLFEIGVDPPAPAGRSSTTKVQARASFSPQSDNWPNQVGRSRPELVVTLNLPRPSIPNTRVPPHLRVQTVSSILADMSSTPSCRRFAHCSKATNFSLAAGSMISPPSGCRQSIGFELRRQNDLSLSFSSSSDQKIGGLSSFR